MVVPIAIEPQAAEWDNPKPPLMRATLMLAPVHLQKNSNALNLHIEVL